MVAPDVWSIGFFGVTSNCLLVSNDGSCFTGARFCLVNGALYSHIPRPQGQGLYGSASRPASSSFLTAKNGFVTVTPFHVKPSCKSSERRSEERRVGKECRYRWSQEHKKEEEERNKGDST